MLNLVPKSSTQEFILERTGFPYLGQTGEQGVVGKDKVQFTALCLSCAELGDGPLGNRAARHSQYDWSTTGETLLMCIIY